MFGPWFNLAMLTAESQQVVGLRLVRIAWGGTNALEEAQLMVQEKMDAARQAAEQLMMGGSIDCVVGSYRTKVQANATRLMT